MANSLLSVDGRPIGDVTPLCLDPSAAQLQVWLARARRDRTLISDREMAVVERVAGPLAQKSVTMFNPFTGEIRKVSR